MHASPNSNVGTSSGRPFLAKLPRAKKSNLSSPGQLSLLTLSLAAALSVLATPPAWALDTPATQSTYSWSSDDVSISNGVTIGGSSVATALTSNGSSLGTLTNQGLVSGTSTGLLSGSGSSATLIDNGTLGTIIGGAMINGALGTFNNSGTISASGIINTGVIGTLNNSGITGTIGTGTIGTAIQNSGSIGLLSNSGIITGNVGIYNSSAHTANSVPVAAGTIGSLVNSGTINGASSGINNAGTIGMLSNTGVIHGARGISNGVGSTSTISTTIGVLINEASGTISGSTSGVRNFAGGSIGLLSNAGLISGDVSGIWNLGTIATLSNTGHITANLNSAINNAGGIDILNNGGSITSAGVGATVAGLNNSGTIGTLNNTGLISSSSSGIYNTGTINALNNLSTLANITGSIALFNFTSAQITSVNNSGTISGSSTGLFTDGIIGTLNNSGLITGQSYALGIGDNGAINHIVNSGTTAGAIDSASASVLTISGGTGSTFGTLTGLSGSIGLLRSASNVRFSSGNLLLNDDVGTGLSVVSNTLVLTGLGTVTNSGAVLQLNNHITITGSYQQNAAATLAIGVSDAAVTNGVVADTGYGRLIVTGNATVDSGSSVTLKKLNTYSFATGQRFVVIQAASATYNASTLNYSVAGYSATGATVADGSNQDLVVTIGAATGTSSSTPANAATDRNASDVFNALFNYSGVNQSLLDVFNPALALTDPQEANQAGQRLSPTATKGAAGSGAQAAANAVGGAANDRIDTQRGGGGGDSGVATGESTLNPALWGRAFGGRANQGTRDGIAGFHANYGGVLIGGDALVNQDWRVGGLFSYARTNVGNDGTNSGSSASVNAYGLMAYAGFDGKPWYVNLTAGVSRQNYNTTRHISFTGFSGVANGSYNGSVITASAQAGYPLDVGTTTITPLAGLKYSGLRQDGYTESGGSGAALTVNGSTSSSVKSEVGVKAEQSFLTSYGMLKPSVQLGWNHEFRDTRQTTSASFAADTTGSTAFTTLGVTPLKDTAQLSLGAALLQSKNLTVSARYTVEAASGYTAQTGDLTLRWQY